MNIGYDKSRILDASKSRILDEKSTGYWVKNMMSFSCSMGIWAKEAVWGLAIAEKLLKQTFLSFYWIFKEMGVV